jgi:hypothetical protein
VRARCRIRGAIFSTRGDDSPSALPCHKEASWPRRGYDGDVRKQTETEVVKKPKLNRVIAEREFRLVSRGGKRQRVNLKLGKPRRIREASTFHCVYQIEGLEEGTRIGRIGGADSLQALQLAMQMAHIEMVHTSAYQEGRLTWAGDPDLKLPADDSTMILIRKIAGRRPPPAPPRAAPAPSRAGPPPSRPAPARSRAAPATSRPPGRRLPRTGE